METIFQGIFFKNLPFSAFKMSFFALEIYLLPLRFMDQEKKFQIYQEWKRLVNMSATEILDFATSPTGKAAGLSPDKAQEKGIRSGRDSALALIRMIPKGRGIVAALENWSPAEWRWAAAQVSFIKRMKGMRKRIQGNPYFKNGKMTRWLSSLLIWGHDPRKL